MEYSYGYDTVIGRLYITADEENLLRISFDAPSGLCKETALIKETFKQLSEYFSGKRVEFNLPLAPSGTEFQKQVWNALLKIPYGETRSYKELAQIIGNEKASRAVGMANNKNPLMIVIPCHRVIGANGNLTGYAGGIGVKKRLLELESGKNFSK